MSQRRPFPLSSLPFPAYGDAMKYIRAALILLMALVIAGFIQQNSELTVIKYFTWQSPPLPISLFVIAAFIAGYVLALLLGFSGDFRGKYRLFMAERETKRLRKQLAERTEAEGGEAAEAGETVKLPSPTDAGGEEGTDVQGGIEEPDRNALEEGGGGSDETAGGEAEDTRI